MAESPQHVAIIMDGNGRWAKSRGMPRVAGHRASVKVVRKIVEECAQRDVKYLTLFAFSSENWLRPADEVGMLMGLFLDALVREVADLHRNQVRLRFIGDRDQLALELKQRMLDAEELTKKNTGLGLLSRMADAGILLKPADRSPPMRSPTRSRLPTSTKSNSPHAWRWPEFRTPIF
jgi:undecaprenyl diphosphate synthase